MALWSEDDFREQATRIGGSDFANAHATFLTALRGAGASPTFDGAGPKQATYKVRVEVGTKWHMLRVWANGRVILMVNHLRKEISPLTADLARRRFARHLRYDTKECPSLARNPKQFIEMDFDDVARAASEVADSVRKR